MLDEQRINPSGLDPSTSDRKQGIKLGYVAANIFVMTIGMFQFGKITHHRHYTDVSPPPPPPLPHCQSFGLITTTTY